MTTDSEQLGALRTALVAKAELQRQIEQQSETTRTLKERDAALEKKEGKLVDAERYEAGLRLLDGEESAPPNTKRRKDLLAIRAEREPLPAGIALSLEREAELRKSAVEIDQRIATHAFAAASEIRANAAKAIKGGLDALAPYVVTMAAADQMLRGITSEQPVFAENVFPDEFSGAFVAGKLLKGLTYFIRPEPLADASFAKAVAEETEKLIAKTTEGQKP